MNRLPTLEELINKHAIKEKKQKIIKQKKQKVKKEFFYSINLQKKEMSVDYIRNNLLDFILGNIHFVYILECKELNNIEYYHNYNIKNIEEIYKEYGFYFYVGETGNIIKRLNAHYRRKGNCTTEYFNTHQLIYLEVYKNINHDEALYREKYLNNMNIIEKISMIETHTEIGNICSIIHNYLLDIINKDIKDDIKENSYPSLLISNIRKALPLRLQKI